MGKRWKFKPSRRLDGVYRVVYEDLRVEGLEDRAALGQMSHMTFASIVARASAISEAWIRANADTQEGDKVRCARTLSSLV